MRDITEYKEYDISKLDGDDAIEGYRAGFSHAFNIDVLILGYSCPAYDRGYGTGYKDGMVAYNNQFIIKEILFVYKRNCLCQI
tara:strand:- start:1795 stop:2043 length:249 start_codon:yes stop_codon:yes gene_type:complete